MKIRRLFFYDYKPNHNLYIYNYLPENDDVNNIHVINYSTQNNDYTEGNNDIIDNHKYHNISHKNINKDENKSKDSISNNIEINKSEAQRFNPPPQLERREISRYYHTIVPRKYSYGGDEGIQISYTIDNHRYSEIYKTSDNKNKKIILKSLPKNNKLKNGRIKDFSIASTDYANYRYKAMDYSPEYLTIQTSEEKLKNAPNEKLLFNSNGEINHNNDNIKYLRNKNILPEDDEYNINSRDYFYSSYNKYDTLNNENNNIKFRNRLYDNNNNIYDPNSISKSNNNYNYFEPDTNRNLDINIFNNKIYSIPKSYSLINLNRNNFSNPPIIHNEYNFTNTNSNKQMINPRNIDYAILRQAVKLALLKKQMKEQEKNWNSNNSNIKINKNLDNFLKNRFKQKPRIANDYAILLEKTNKLLKNKKYRKESDFNYKNNYNRNMIQTKLKMWKP